MAMTPEGKVKALVKKELDRRGVFHFSPAANGFGKAGIPDIIACWRGRFIAIECKAPGKGVTGLTEPQKARIAEIDAAGGITAVISSDDQASVAGQLAGMFAALRMMEAADA